MRNAKLAAIITISLLLGGCASVEKKDYTQFRLAEPRSILVLPVVNRSVDVDAPDYFLSTISRPIAERGYYVFPVNLTKRILEDDGLSDADLVHKTDPTRLKELFGADAILYISIERWDARYVIFSTTVTVEFSYSLKDGKTGEELWGANEKIVYQPQRSNSGNALADLVAQAVVAAVTKAAPNYIPLAQRANFLAVTRPHRGIPAGPYREDFRKDMDNY